MKLNNLLLNFPPPKYLDVPYIGIVFSDNSIRTLTLNKKNRHPSHFTETSLEDGIIQLGKVKDETKLLKVLSDLRVNFDTPYVRFVVPDEISYVFTSRIPVVQGKNAEESVGFILEENVPLPFSDICFDFSVQKIEESQSGYFARVAVTASSNTVVSKYIDVLKKAGFEPILCLSESQATAFSVVPKGNKDMNIIIHMHKKSAGIYVVNGHAVELSSMVPIAPSDKVIDIARAIKGELERALDYSEKALNANNSQKIIQAYLCGEYDVLKAISDSIGQIQGINMLPANVWENAFSIEDFVPDMPYENSLKFASAVGVLLSK